MDVRKPRHGALCLPNHLPADIHRKDFPEVSRKRARHTPGAAADFEYAHLLRVLALTDVTQIVQDLLFERDHAGAVELFIIPLRLARDHVVARVLARTALPVAPHAQQLPRSLEYSHLIYC